MVYIPSLPHLIDEETLARGVSNLKQLNAVINPAEATTLLLKTKTGSAGGMGTREHKWKSSEKEVSYSLNVSSR